MLYLWNYILSIGSSFSYFKGRVSFFLIVFSLLLFFITVSVGIINLDSYILRYSASFLCVFLVFYLCYFYHELIIYFYVKYISFITYIWFFVVIIEFISRILNLQLFDYIVDIFGINSSRSSIERGLTGLSPEPSYLGLFALINFFILNGLRSIFPINLSLLIMWGLIALSSLSFTPFLVLAISLFFYFLFVKNIKYKFLIVSVFGLTLLFLPNYFINNDFEFRIFIILKRAIADPTFFLEDLSSASRLSSLLIGFLILNSNFFFTGAIWYDFDYVSNYLFANQFSGNISFYLMDGISTSPKIKSSFGSILYLFGFWGLLYVYFLIKCLTTSYKQFNFSFQISLWLILWSFFIQVPFSTLFYLLIIVSISYKFNQAGKL